MESFLWTKPEGRKSGRLGMNGEVGLGLRGLDLMGLGLRGFFPKTLQLGWQDGLGRNWGDRF